MTVEHVGYVYLQFSVLAMASRDHIVDGMRIIRNMKIPGGSRPIGTMKFNRPLKHTFNYLKSSARTLPEIVLLYLNLARK